MLDNWVRELKLWCPSLKVVIYYGKVTQSGFSPEDKRDVRFIIFHFHNNNFIITAVYEIVKQH